jgi:hypothetical protein
MRFGVRQLLRQRGSSLVAVVTLALGIGVSTAIFSIIDATMLRPLPYPNPEHWSRSAEETMPDGRVSRAPRRWKTCARGRNPTTCSRRSPGMAARFAAASSRRDA